MFGRKRPTVPANASVQPASPMPAEPAAVLAPQQHRAAKEAPNVIRQDYFSSLRQAVFAAIDVTATLTRPREQVRRDVERIVDQVVEREKYRITQAEQAQIVTELLNDMFGLGPIEPLLADDEVNDIMVNGPDHVYVERGGRLERTQLTFRDNSHVLHVAQRIAASVGRRVDETSPMVDARLSDGSRVNVVVPPLALDGPTISIRKFSRRGFTLQRLAQQGAMSPAMAQLLEVAAACRLNIIVSGGTGSGKTTLLNAISRNIDVRERIITIEDAAELQLQQPHVVRMETRPPNIEGLGAVSQQDLVRNALRMRPDRIILGETRGAEAFDVLQAMNTGHNGSMTTLHANSPRDALVRLESMVMMATSNLPLYSIRRQIVSAVHLIIQVERSRDGRRRVSSIAEIVGMEDETVVMQDLFLFRHDPVAAGEDVRGRFESTGLRPAFTDIARHFGLEARLLEALRT
jgi:pilus assembly protein CpaF